MRQNRWGEAAVHSLWHPRGLGVAAAKGAWVFLGSLEGRFHPKPAVQRLPRVGPHSQPRELSVGGTFIPALWTAARGLLAGRCGRVPSGPALASLGTRAQHSTGDSCHCREAAAWAGVRGSGLSSCLFQTPALPPSAGQPETRDLPSVPWWTISVPPLPLPGI